MKLTIPQTIMMNFESWRQSREIELRCEHKRKKKEAHVDRVEADPSLPEFGGAKLSEIQEDPEKLDAYLRDWTGFG